MQHLRNTLIEVHFTRDYRTPKVSTQEAFPQTTYDFLSCEIPKKWSFILNPRIALQ